MDLIDYLLDAYRNGRKLLGAGRQFVGDAMPGGMLNPEWTPDRVRTAAEVAAFEPGLLGSAASAGLTADDLRRGEYESAALNAVGMLPFIPPLAGNIKQLMPKNLAGFEAIEKQLGDKYVAGKISEEDFRSALDLMRNQKVEAIRDQQAKLRNSPAKSVGNIFEDISKIELGTNVLAFNRATGQVERGTVVLNKPVRSGSEITFIPKVQFSSGGRPQSVSSSEIKQVFYGPTK